MPKKNALSFSYILAISAVIISILLISMTGAWFTDTDSANGTGQFGTVSLGTFTVASSYSTTLVPTSTLSITGTSVSYTGTVDAYYRTTITFEVYSTRTGSAGNYSYSGQIAASSTNGLSGWTGGSTYGVVSSSGTITITGTSVTVPDLSNAVQGAYLKVIFVVDVIQQQGVTASGSTDAAKAESAFTYMDNNNIDYETGI